MLATFDARAVVGVQVNDSLGFAFSSNGRERVMADVESEAVTIPNAPILSADLEDAPVSLASNFE